jgi:hypothetical protein
MAFELFMWVVLREDFPQYKRPLAKVKTYPPQSPLTKGGSKKNQEEIGSLPLVTGGLVRRGLGRGLRYFCNRSNPYKNPADIPKKSRLHPTLLILGEEDVA